jgi:hypothetical protein
MAMVALAQGGVVAQHDDKTFLKDNACPPLPAALVYPWSKE